MQAIPATGAALGFWYQEAEGHKPDEKPIVVCSLRDASVTEREIAEAFQMAAARNNCPSSIWFGTTAGTSIANAEKPEPRMRRVCQRLSRTRGRIYRWNRFRDLLPNH